MDLMKQLGELAIGSRLKRLSDYIFGNGMEVYKLYGIDFNPYWFPIYYALARNGEMNIKELATELDMSHPAIIKLAKEMEKKGYITSIKVEEDKRKRFLKLTEEGNRMLPEMELIWKDIAQSLGEMLGNHQNNLLGAVNAFEHDFGKLGFLDRVKNMRQKRIAQHIEIIDYDPQYAPDFKRINYHWIKKFFKVEAADIEALENHQQSILEKGGFIYFAKYEDQIVGTCALIKSSNNSFELAKMGVDEAYQGLKIGRKLGEKVIEKARSLEAEELFLVSNKTLSPALELYKKLGFIEVYGSDLTIYERSDIKMVLKLKN